MPVLRINAKKRERAAERWYAGSQGPTAPGALAAAAACQTCAFMVQLSGPLGQLFGVCANEWSPDDAKVVSLDHGCGAHSETDIEPHASDWPDPVAKIDDLDLELVSLVEEQPAAIKDEPEPEVEAASVVVPEPEPGAVAEAVVAAAAAAAEGDSASEAAGETGEKGCCASTCTAICALDAAPSSLSGETEPPSEPERGDESGEAMGACKGTGAERGEEAPGLPLDIAAATAAALP